MVERFTLALCLPGLDCALNRYGTGGNCTFFRCCRLDFYAGGVVLICGKKFRVVAGDFFCFAGVFEGVVEGEGVFVWWFCGGFVVDGVTILVLRNHD